MISQNKPDIIDADIVVIGGGIGGHTFSITAKEKNPELKIIVVEKATAGKTGPSALVGGRYQGFLIETDDFDKSFQHAVEEDDYLCDQEKVEDYLNYSGNVFRSLERWGVKFIKKPDGQYDRPLSRGYHSGMLLDGGGIPNMQALNDYARKIGVVFLDRVMITDLITRQNQVVGVVGFNVRDGQFKTLRSRIVVLATGMTRFKTIQPGHRNDTGDGYAMAYRAGAEMGGFDSTHHNTYGARWEVGPGNNLYVGLGGYFLNALGERFMHKYHPELAERAPFVWLSPSFCIERMERRAPPIYLDLRHFTPDKIETLWQSVPYAMTRYERAGILKNNKFVELIEYTPEGPRPMPCGVVTGRGYESKNISGLFAVGDATSQKGAGGLAAAAVSGVIAALSAAEKAKVTPAPEVDMEQASELKKAAFSPLERQDGVEPSHVILAVQEAIHPYSVAIIRHGRRMEKALKEIETIRDNLLPVMHAYDSHYLMLANEARNMVICAEMFLNSALERKESRLGRLREDYRDMDNVNWLKYIFLKNEKGRMKTWAEDVPIDKYKLKPKREKVLHPFWKIVDGLGYKNTVEEN
ncbi:MAG: FAD-binding protein [Dehalococcoidia bacterium]|nr:FAD-binding protein [Dehalococcoidia bacterium]MDZ4245828.1 FAD-binding protein [Dehalococcoidia bacterium]